MIFMYGRKVKDYGTSTWLRSIDVPRLDSVMITTSRAAGTVRQWKVKIPDPIHNGGRQRCPSPLAAAMLHTESHHLELKYW
jgi:hypothetical protein